MTGKRSVKKTVQKAVKHATRRAGQLITDRYYGNKQINVAQIASDVAMLQKLINVEKKRYEKVSSTPQLIGQVNANISGALCIDLTPTPSEGITYSSRNGASIKMTSWYAKFQITQQSATQHPMRIKLMFFHVKESVIAPATFLLSYFNYNSFVGGGNTIIDYNSDVNPDNFKKYTLIRTHNLTLQPDPLASTTMLKTFSVGMKYKKGIHVRFDGDTNTVTNGQLLMVVLCDSGNLSTSTASTLSNIPLTAASTGASMLYDYRAYYVDN